MNANEVTIPRDEYLRLIEIEEEREIDKVHERICSNCFVRTRTQEYLDEQFENAMKYRRCLKAVMAFVGPFTFGEKHTSMMLTPSGSAAVSFAKRVKEIIDNAIGDGELFK